MVGSWLDAALVSKGVTGGLLGLRFAASAMRTRGALSEGMSYALIVMVGSCGKDSIRLWTQMTKVSLMRLRNTYF